MVTNAKIHFDVPGMFIHALRNATKIPVRKRKQKKGKKIKKKYEKK